MICYNFIFIYEFPTLTKDHSVSLFFVTGLVINLKCLFLAFSARLLTILLNFFALFAILLLLFTFLVPILSLQGLFPPDDPFLHFPHVTEHCFLTLLFLHCFFLFLHSLHFFFGHFSVHFDPRKT